MAWPPVLSELDRAVVCGQLSYTVLTAGVYGPVVAVLVVRSVLTWQICAGEPCPAARSNTETVHCAPLLCAHQNLQFQH